ncbi:hypothetical protein CapIbe_023573 [Capra ibex]
MRTRMKHLHADCFRGHVEVVCYLADEHQVDLEGAQVHLCSIKNNVAPRDCTEAGSPGVLQLLFRCQAYREWDGCGMTAPLAAHVMDHTSIVEDLSQEQPAGEEMWPGMAREGPSTSQACV